MRKAPYKRVKLTPQHQRYWEDTLAALSWIGPGFVHVLYTMLASSGHRDTALFTDELNHTAATDGYQIIIKPEPFFKYSLLERCFIVLHEVMHEILNHVRLGYAFHVKGTITYNGKTLPYNHEFANIMQDCTINAVLIASNLGQFNPEWLRSDQITDQDQWIEQYFKHYQPDPPGTTPKGFGEGQTAGRFDSHLPPGESEGMVPEEAPQRSEQQWEIVTKQAMDIQRAQGKMPSSLEMFFDHVLKPKVDWTQHIRGLIMRLSGSGAYDWRKLDRRLIVRGIGSPGMSGHGAGLIIVGGDTSGSVFSDPSLIMRWVGEIGGIIEDLQPEEVHVVWCDTRVRRVDICTDAGDVRKMVFKGIPGGGGTSFEPVFNYIAENDLRPDALLYLTDGYGSFPKHEPDFPVIWGDISHGAAHYPWGSVVDVPTHDDTAD